MVSGLTSRNAESNAPVMVWQGSQAINIADALLARSPSNGNLAPFDLTPFNAYALHARPIDSSTESFSGAAQVLGQPAGGLLVYGPQPTDVNSAATLRAWWRLTRQSDSATVDTPEFDLWVVAHQQGVGVVMGLIARRARSFMPASWDKLRKLATVGDWELQNRIEANKRRYLRPSAYVDAGSEHLLDPFVVDWLVRRSVLDVIPTAVDYWSDARTSATTPQEHATYANRIDALEKLHALLQDSVDDAMEEFASVAGPYSRKRAFSPKSDTEGVPLITADPVGHPQSFGTFAPRVLTPDYYLYPYSYPFPDFKLPTTAGISP